MPQRPPSLAHLALSFAALFVVLPNGSAAAADPERDANVYMTGAEVRVTQPIDGDLFAAAGRVGIDAPVSGDAVVGAGSIDASSDIGDDLRAAGAIVTVTGSVGGEALIAAAHIGFGPATRIGGRTRLFGRDIAVAGRLGAGLNAYGRDILLLGEIDGPVKLAAEHVEILPSARIRGDIVYRSPEAIRIHPGARVEGKITREPMSFAMPREKSHLPQIPFSPLFTFGLFAAGILLILLFPRFTTDSQQMIAAAPMKSVGLGTAIFFSFPPVILLLIITIIGIPVALGLAALYGIALLTGYLITALFLGSRLLRIVRRQAEAGTGWRAAALLAGLLLLWAARNVPVPFLGGLVLIAALVAGIGAMVLQAFSRYADRS